MNEIEQSTEIMSPENKDVEEFSTNALQKRQQRYEVSFPWKENKMELKLNRDMVEKRLISLEND